MRPFEMDRRTVSNADFARFVAPTRVVVLPRAAPVPLAPLLEL